MEKIQQFFRHIGERLSNPFLFSFLISWLIANYKVIIGLCFYSISELSIDGYSSYLDLIAKSVTWWTGVLIPLIGASLYTFAFPYFKRWVKLIYLRINQGEEKSSLEILKNGSISTVKYLRLRESYVQSEKHLRQVIDEESEFFKKRTELNEKISDLRKEVSDLQNENEKLNKTLTPLKEFKELRDVEFLNGSWEGITGNRENQSSTFEFKFEIEKNAVSLKLNDRMFLIPIVVLVRFKGTFYFEFKKVEEKAPFVNSPNYGVYSRQDELKAIVDIDLLQNRLYSERGYYIFKIETEDEIRCYSRLDDYFTLHKKREFMTK